MTANRKLSTHDMVTCAVLAALSAVLFLTLEIPIFGNIYKLDFSNIPVLLAAFAMGPVPALITAAIKVVIHLVVKGLGSTMGVGDIADFVFTAAFVLPSALIYRRDKSRRGALTGMIVGILATTAVALAVNAFVLFPLYMKLFHMDIAAIGGAMGLKSAGGILPVLVGATLPFNLLKGVVLCVLTYVIYKPLSPVLHGRKRSGGAK